MPVRLDVGRVLAVLGVFRRPSRGASAFTVVLATLSFKLLGSIRETRKGNPS